VEFYLHSSYTPSQRKQQRHGVYFVFNYIKDKNKIVGVGSEKISILRLNFNENRQTFGIPRSSFGPLKSTKSKQNLRKTTELSLKVTILQYGDHMPMHLRLIYIY
jgi:hypothetical protein